jgi:hypothetical protein
VDYQYLTSVSDISRQEALEALSSLSYRMSQSAYSLHQQRQEERHKRQRSKDARARRKIPSSKSVSDVTDNSRLTKASGDRKQPEVRKVHLKSASTPQLAMVRPKARRSSSSKSDVSSTTLASPPLPSPPTPTGRNRRTSPQIRTPPPIPEISLPELPGSLATPIMRRRQDKLTPSMHTFATASTRLGEIPELKWSIPYDHDAMTRLNKEHGGRPWPPPAEPMKPKRGFLSLFKKSEMKTAEVAA